MFKNFVGSARSLKNTRVIAFLGVLAAMYAVLGILKIPFPDNNNRLSFTFIATATAAMVAGPVPAMLVGGLGDILGYFLNTGGGVYFPGFTLSAMLVGLIYGFCFYKKRMKYSLLWTMLATFLVMLFVNILLNTFWLSVMYGKAYQYFAAARVIKNLILFPVHVIVIEALFALTEKTGIRKKFSCD